MYLETLESRCLLSVAAPLTVSENGRYIVRPNGKAFFYMADTVWEMLDNLNRSDADLYLSTRAAQGFTVIQTEINARFGQNAYGEEAFFDDDPTRPNEAYFQHVDYIVNRANALGIQVALVPADTRWVENGIFTPTNAYILGRYLGRRYANADMIWVLGGDVAATEGNGTTMWNEFAAGITRGAANKDSSKVLITYHPYLNQSSTLWFHNSFFLDFNAVQTGHFANKDVYTPVTNDYTRNPAKPVMVIEPGYEDIPTNGVPNATRLTAHDVRKAQYWALFAGAHGITYGNNNVYQFVTNPTPTSGNLATQHWKEAIKSDGAYHMGYIKRLMLTKRPYLTRVPDQSLITSSNFSGQDHIQATRDANGTYAYIYSGGGKAFTVDLDKLSGSVINAWWFNPRKGKFYYHATFNKSGTRTFTPPTSGVNGDWVLVLDDANWGYLRPPTVSFLPNRVPAIFSATAIKEDDQDQAFAF